MKGVVFTEFLELVEDRFGLEVADQIIETSNLPSHGVYTSIGTYHHNELLQLVQQLSKTTGVPVPDLVRTFGEYLFRRFVVSYAPLFANANGTFRFLESIENYIHVEVRKLYPDAELPSFECKQEAPNCMEMLYHSSRPLADFAEGLILGCVKHFGEPIDIEREDLPVASGTAARFMLRRIT